MAGVISKLGGLKNPMVSYYVPFFLQIFGVPLELCWRRSVIRHAQFQVTTKSLQVGDLIQVEGDKDGARKGLVISQPEHL